MASVRQIMSWWGRDYAYAAVWQVRATLRPGRAGDLLAGTARPVVMLPGVWEPWGFLRPLIGPLSAAGHPVHVVEALGRNSRSVPEAALIVAKHIADNDLHDIVVVAHSKGGLIGKYLMAELPEGERVCAMVAVCTPFAGSEYARYLATPVLRAFSPNDPTTLRLQENLAVNARITTITGVFDPHIPEVARLEGAHSIVIDDGGHFRLLEHPDVVRAVLEIAARGAPAADAAADGGVVGQG